MKAPEWKSLSYDPLFVTPWTIQSMEFSRPEYWSGLPCPPPGDLPNPRIEPRSPALQVDCLLSEPPGKPLSRLLFTAPFCVMSSLGSVVRENWCLLLILNKWGAFPLHCLVCLIWLWRICWSFCYLSYSSSQMMFCFSMPISNMNLYSHIYEKILGLLRQSSV